MDNRLIELRLSSTCNGSRLRKSYSTPAICNFALPSPSKGGGTFVVRRTGTDIRIYCSKLSCSRVLSRCFGHLYSPPQLPSSGRWSVWFCSCWPRSCPEEAGRKICERIDLNDGPAHHYADDCYAADRDCVRCIKPAAGDAHYWPIPVLTSGDIGGPLLKEHRTSQRWASLVRSCTG